MKICVISTPIFAVPLTGYGGLEVIAYQCADGLSQLGHDVSLVAPEGSRFSRGNLIQVPLRCNEQHAFSVYYKQLKDFDVIIDHSWNKWSMVMKEDGQLTAPVLGVMHAPVHTMYQTLPRVKKPCFVCISEDQKNHFEALHSPCKARVCYNGVDVNYYQDIGIPRTKRFLFLARFSSIKGPDLAIQACKKAGVGLDLVGDTTITNEPEYMQNVLKMADGDQIKIHGNATRSECVFWYSQAHCMIHPNQRFREPFGLAPVESMLCRCPVIAWDYGAMRETIWGGTLVNSIEEMVIAIKEHAREDFLSDSIRESCRIWASKFSVTDMVKRYEELCTEAITTGGW